VAYPFHEFERVPDLKSCPAYYSGENDQQFVSSKGGSKGCKPNLDF
jgi:hypothetical protein